MLRALCNFGRVDCDLVVALVRTNTVDVAVGAKSALGLTGDISG